MGSSKIFRPDKWKTKDWLLAGATAFLGTPVLGSTIGATAGATMVNDSLKIKQPEPQIPNYDYGFDFGEYTAAMQEQMAEQARAQQEYAQMMAALQQDQLRMQQEAQELANLESLKDPSDYPAAGADTARRRMMLRRGLMSTFTRYGGGSTSGGAGSAKAAKLGG